MPEAKVIMCMRVERLHSVLKGFLTGKSEPIEKVRVDLIRLTISLRLLDFCEPLEELQGILAKFRHPMNWHKHSFQHVDRNLEGPCCTAASCNKLSRPCLPIKGRLPPGRPFGGLDARAEHSRALGTDRPERVRRRFLLRPGDQGR